MILFFNLFLHREASLTVRGIESAVKEKVFMNYIKESKKKENNFFFIKFDSIGIFRISKSYSALCIHFCLFPHFYVTLNLPAKSAYVGLAEVVSVVVAVL